MSAKLYLDEIRIGFIYGNDWCLDCCRGNGDRDLRPAAKQNV